MLLVIDVGNTNTVIGIYDGDEPAAHWRLRTVRDSTEDEFNLLAKSLFDYGNVEMESIGRVVISCVVPPVFSILDKFCKKYLGIEPLWVDSDSFSGMPILYKNPGEVGADRIVNAVGAYAKYKTSLVVIDFGTATTFDVVSERGEYVGGAISPGVMISAEALFMKASKLPRVEIFQPPERVIGRDTAESIKSGIIYGYAGLVDGMVRRLVKEMDVKPKIIATGGLAELMAGISDSIETVEPMLTLEGLKIIAETVVS